MAQGNAGIDTARRLILARVLEGVLLPPRLPSCPQAVLAPPREIAQPTSAEGDTADGKEGPTEISLVADTISGVSVELQSTGSEEMVNGFMAPQLPCFLRPFVLQIGLGCILTSVVALVPLLFAFLSQATASLQPADAELQKIKRGP